MTHAQQRLVEREPSLSAIPDLFERLTRMAADGRSKAVWLARLGTQRGNYLTSSGDTLWALLRRGAVVTVMRRRRNQPCTPQAFDVDQVCWTLDK